MTVPDHIVFDAEPLIAHADDEPGTSCIPDRGPRTRVRGFPYVQYRGDPREEASEPISADAGSGLLRCLSAAGAGIVRQRGDCHCLTGENTRPRCELPRGHIQAPRLHSFTHVIQLKSLCN